MYRFAVASLLLVITASANAGITVRMEVTDRGVGRDPTDVYSASQYVNRMNTPTSPGEELLVHIFMTSDIDLDIRAMQVQWTTSTYPVELMGVDVDTGNQQVDGIGNFWFDYTGLDSQFGFNFGGFPANGLIGGFFKGSGEYDDFSNVLQGAKLVPTAASAAFTGVSAGDNPDPQLAMVAGVEMHLGAMAIVVPESGTEDFTLDFVTATGEGRATATFIQHGFDNPQTLASAGGDDIIAYAGGARGTQLGGPIVFNGATGVFSIVPEPATLALLGFGGIAALRRRRKAA